jgi:hypothetical protein
MKTLRELNAIFSHFNFTFSILLCYMSILHIFVGPGAQSVRAGRSRDRIPVEARFFAHVQTGPGAHPATCTMGTGSFPGVKRPGRDADHPPPPSAEVELLVYLYSPSGPLVACYRVTFTFTFNQPNKHIKTVNYIKRLHGRYGTSRLPLDGFE